MSASVSRWDLPLVTGRPVQARRVGKTVEELEEVERRAYAEAYAKGRQEGLAAAHKEMQKIIEQLTSQVARLDSVCASLALPLEEMDEQVERELMQLAVTIARQLVRRELRADPAQVIAVVRETVGLLPAAARDVRVHLHPEDAAVVRERLASPVGSERAWSIVEDPVLTRGGCRVSTDTANIDARLETRLNAAISALLGEERAPGARVAS
ncbi:MAG TPA: flagellar assembly protein FliH [Steroidobacter sp.]|nr:flagellar assembly protein FliH [Steroidobacter sp.]